MKVLIAPDSFKGSLEATEFCEITRRAVLSITPSSEIITMPMADGGEGMVDSLLSLPGSKKVYVRVSNPLNKPIQAYYNYISTSNTAIIEMASASGLPLLTESEKDALQTSTLGTGQMLQDAIERGAKNLIIGLGGSATTDAGIGCLAALGFQFLNKQGGSVSLNGKGLQYLDKIVAPEFDFSALNIKVACDISNPLFGEMGAAHIFSPQKGATPEEVEILDEGLINFYLVVKRYFGINVSSVVGAGAAGGMGAGMMLLGAKLEPGFKITAELMGFEKLFNEHDFDLVITGEGQFNQQSQYGKVPVEVAKVAKRHNCFVIGLFGAITVDNEHAYEQGLDAVFSIAERPMELAESMAEVKELLFKKVQNVVKIFVN